jgi:hypothetical protein
MNSIEDKFKEQKSKPIDNEHITISCNRFLEKTNVVNEDIIQGVPKVRRKIKCE